MPAQAASTGTTQEAPFGILQAIVLVSCDTRQGGGTVINGQQGFILTNAHVAIDVQTKKPATECLVGFINEDRKPTYFYRATIQRWIFNSNRGQDFAILQIEERLSPHGVQTPYPFIATNEFASVGDHVGVYGYQGGGEELMARDGTIRSFNDGYIQVDAEIQPGDSGGTALDSQFRLIGVPTRIVTITTLDGDTFTTTDVIYEFVDIREVMLWLDTFGINEHDRYFIHGDGVRYHKNAVFVDQRRLNCEYVARTAISPTTFCLTMNNERYAFPNEATYMSWYADFSAIFSISPEELRKYTPTRNVTFKPGTLVKSATSPSVYIVVDVFGTIRWVPTEEKAKNLWGNNWASFVHDIPDEFFGNYTIAQPLEV